MINYTELKAAMTAKGFAVSEGAGWTAEDQRLYLEFLYFGYNELPPVPGCYGLQYTELLLKADPEFPGAGGEPPAPTRELQSIAVTGTATADVGATSQLTATGTYSEEPLTEDLTSTATWVSATEGVATVEAGLVTGVAAGTSDITASVEDIESAATAFTVTAVRTLVSVVVTGDQTVVAGETINLVATANYSAAPLTEDVTNEVTWDATPSSAATISASGVLTGVDEGTASVTATLEEITSAAFSVSVTAAQGE